MILEEEVNLIKTRWLRRTVKDFLRKKEKQLLKLPSSVTGKHHHEDECGEGGLVLHTKRVVWFAKELSTEFNLPEFEHDCLITSAIFHDVGNILLVKTKGRKYTRNENLYKLHPIYSAYLSLSEICKETSPEQISNYVSTIFNMIVCHMGHWYPWLPQPKTLLEHLLCAADYLASRKELKIVVEKNGS